MKNWLKVTLALCAFGTLREIRPSEPFVSEFLLGEWRNITNEQLNQDIYPIGTYSYLSLLLVVFLITDFLRFKPIIVLSGLSGIACYAILLWTSSLEFVKASQFAYGLYMATEVAYFTYIYAQVDDDKYPKVSSYTRMAALTGRFVSGLVGQLLTMYHIMDFRELNYITFTAQILATIWALTLPPVQYGIYFYRKEKISTNDFELKDEKEIKANDSNGGCCDNFKEASKLIMHHIYSAYTKPKVIVWSYLYAVVMALFVQIQTYVQLLWWTILEGDVYAIKYNGFVEALTTILGAGGALLASFYGNNMVPMFTTTVMSISMLCSTCFKNILVAYGCYVVTGVMYHYTITLTSAKIAGELTDDSCFGLVFGINTFVGTGFQSILTYVLISHYKLPIYSQFDALSILCITVALVWVVGWIVHECKK